MHRGTGGPWMRCLAVGALGGLVLCAAHAGDAIKGRQVYEQYCKSCHGVRGQGALPLAPNFTRGEGLMQSDRALVSVIASGKKVMPGFRGLLDEQEILDVIAFIRTFY